MPVLVMLGVLTAAGLLLVRGGQADGDLPARIVAAADQQQAGRGEHAEHDQDGHHAPSSWGRAAAVLAGDALGAVATAEAA